MGEIDKALVSCFYSNGASNKKKMRKLLLG